jgi:hypothetical protein
LHSQEFSRPIAEMGVGKPRRTFEVNVMGTVICTLAASTRSTSPQERFVTGETLRVTGGYAAGFEIRLSRAFLKLLHLRYVCLR